MPRNGSGTYQLPAGNPVVTGTIISSTTQNTTMSDVATALTNSIAKDGQTVPTANLPMGGFKHTGAADATATGQYLTYGQDGAVLGDTTIDGTLTIDGDATIDGLLQLDQSSDIVAAATTDLGTATGNAVTVTHASGTVAITSFGGASLQSGTELTITWAVSGGSLSVTHNATSLIIPGGADLPIADGDVWKVQKISDSLAYWRVVNVSKADGTPVVSGADLVGELFDWPHASTPSYGLLCNGAAVSRTTYAALFAVIGTTWGVGDGTTTFNLPNIPANYTTVQASGNEGTSTTGETKAHTHERTTFTYASTPGAGSGIVNSSGANGGFNPTQTMGGVSGGGNAANLAAGVRVRKCIRFM